MKLKANISKSDYKPTKADFLAMSVALKCGYRIFPTFLPTQTWVRHNPLIILCGTYKGKGYDLLGTPFDQKYLTYYVMLFYQKFHKKHISKIEVVKPVIMKKMTFPPPPPPAKELMAPPPPNRG
jgi:hypothetical protein